MEPNKKPEDKFYDRGFIFLCLAYVALIWGPINGITVWYDEAWRLVISIHDDSLVAFIKRWFIDGRPAALPVIYIFFVRIVHGAFGFPVSDYVLRFASLFAALGVLASVRLIVERWSGNRLTALGAVSLLVANSYLAFYAISIKEHIWLVLFVCLWGIRLQRLIMENKKTGSPDIVLCWALIVFSPLASIPIAACVGLLVLAGKLELRFVLFGVIPAALVSLGHRDALRLVNEEFVNFIVSQGLPAPGPEVLFGNTNSAFSDLPEVLLQLGGVPSTGPVRVMAITGWLAAVTAALWKRNRPLILLFLFPPATVLFFQALTGIVGPRLVLWLAPLMAIGAAMTLLKSRVGSAVFLMLLLSTLSGWIPLWQKYPEKQRFDLAITRLGSKSIDRERDVILHVHGLLYFPHEVFDPAAPKGVFPIPDDGINLIGLHPDFSFARVQAIPRSLLWTDTRLKEFDGGAVWAVTSYDFSPHVTSHLTTHLFGGRNQTDTFADWPYFWVRVSRRETEPIEPR